MSDVATFLNVPFDLPKQHWFMAYIKRLVIKEANNQWFIMHENTAREVSSRKFEIEKVVSNLPGPFNSHDDATAWLAWATMVLNK